jgi:hypothetical protein
MKIHEVQENLRNTIAGKEKMLEGLHPNNPFQTEYMDEGEAAAHRATIEFLKINIKELKRILQDVDKAVEQYNELAWAIGPEVTK